jgi:hypothetical protein
MRLMAIVAALALSTLAPGAEKPVKVNPDDVIFRGADRLMIYDGQPIIIRCEAEVRGTKLWLWDGQKGQVVLLPGYKGGDMPKGNYKITGTADVEYLDPPLRIEDAKLEKDPEQDPPPRVAPAALEQPKFNPLSASDLFNHDAAKKYDGKAVHLQCTGYVRGTTLMVIVSGKQTQVDLPGYKGQTYDKPTRLTVEGTAEVPTGIVQVFRIKEATIKAMPRRVGPPPRPYPPPTGSETVPPSHPSGTSERP